MGIFIHLGLISAEHLIRRFYFLNYIFKFDLVFYGLRARRIVFKLYKTILA
jgi:hypothetical protein